MLNPVAREALYSATYVENYLDCVENLPDDLQRHLTRMRELDVSYRACLRDVQNNVNNSLLPKDVSNSVQNNKRNKAISRIQQSLIVAQELGDEKLQIVQLLQDLIDHKSRQLDLDYRNLVSCLDYGNGNSIKEEHMVVDPPSNLKDTTGSDTIQLQSSGNNGTGNRGGVGAGSGQGNISPTINHEREREKDRSERASKRARRARNDNASGNDIMNERSGNGRDEGREGRGERERGGERDRDREREARDRDRSESHLQGQAQLHHSQVEPPPRGGNNTSNKKNTTGKMGTGKKKKRKSRQNQSNQRDETPPPEDPDPIDPDEPTYCLCDQISFGEMILCDNDLCPIEWFHFSCVGLSTKPKGKWFCPKCRGDRPNIMKPKVQFLKELERYNKEKEEKA